MTESKQKYQYDYLIVGAGLYGAVFAREMRDAGKKVLILERRNHIAGNCFTEEKEGIHIHKYGAHIFHTRNKEIWDYLLRFTEMNDYQHELKCKVQENAGEKLYSFPINLKTFEQLYGITNEEDAKKHLENVRIRIDNPKNLKEWILSQVGEDLYEKFIKGYTQKQWNRDPEDLDASIIKRIPIRFHLDERYFDDPYQGIPIAGHTKMISNILEGIEVRTETDYLLKKDEWNGKAEKIIYTGKIDEYFNYELGELPWRSLRFEEERVEQEFFQSYSVINYSSAEIPFTRILEHKHFININKTDISFITREYPENWDRYKEAYYPVYDSSGRSELYDRYLDLARGRDSRVSFKGRLGEYIYRDMCPTVGAALNFSKKQLKI